jgi:hypothetical protein
VHLAHLVRDAGVEKDAFGGRGLSGINVGTDADVAIPLDGSGSGHDALSGVLPWLPWLSSALRVD